MPRVSCRWVSDARTSCRRPSTTKPHFSYTRRARGFDVEDLQREPVQAQLIESVIHDQLRHLSPVAPTEHRLAGEPDAEARRLVGRIELVQHRLPEKRAVLDPHHGPVRPVVLLGSRRQPALDLEARERAMRAGETTDLRVGEAADVVIEDGLGQWLEAKAPSDQDGLVAEDVGGDHRVSQAAPARTRDCSSIACGVTGWLRRRGRGRSRSTSRAPAVLIVGAGVARRRGGFAGGFRRC